MERFLYFRQKTMGVLARYKSWWLPVTKFVFMVAVLSVINWHLGYRDALMFWGLMVALSLAACLLPWSGITALAAIYLLGHVSALTLEGAAVLIITILAAAMLHYLFLPGASILIVIVPLAFYLKVPCLIPLVAGFLGSALTFIPVGIGVVVYFLMNTMEVNAALFSNPGSTIISNFTQILKGLNNTTVFFTLAIFCLATLVVYGVKHLKVDYAPQVAVAAGGTLELLCFLVQGLAVPASFSMALGWILVECLGCTAIAAVMTMWMGILDYSCTELFQYEDDDYVYYVKAVPKVKMVESERKIQKIEAE